MSISLSNAYQGFGLGHLEKVDHDDAERCRFREHFYYAFAVRARLKLFFCEHVELQIQYCALVIAVVYTYHCCTTQHTQLRSTALL